MGIVQMPSLVERDVSRVIATLLVLSLLLLSVPTSIVGAQDQQLRTCQILADWEEDWYLDDSGNYTLGTLHRYRATFDPPFANGTNPGAVNVTVQHLHEGSEVIDPANVSTISAGGEVDILLTTSPQFGDTISLEVDTAEAGCSRTMQITYWNQPLADHEVTRETDWSLSGVGGDDQGITFDGRGWQKRTGDLLESNELGNGTLFLDMSNNSRGAKVDLELHSIWLNETYDGNELLKQDFEMIGNGSLSLVEGEEGGGVEVNAELKDAYVLRSFSDGEVTERMRFEGSGWMSISGGDNNSTGGAFGQVYLFYFEVWDEDGFRRLEDVQLEANATIRLSGAGESFSFELDEFIFREKWEEGIRTDQYTRLYGSGDFDFVASDEYPYIEVNGTIPILHIQSEGGETISDTVIVDGTYDGDAEGSFGLVRRIVESSVFENATGSMFEADKIQNEFWFNVSTTPIGPIDQEIQAEHNLTYEYVVPQEDWENRTIRYTYIEDNGSVEDEYPENSPIIHRAQAPESSEIFSDHISRETGVCPQILIIGDTFSLVGNKEMVLDVTVTGISKQLVDGHEANVAEWTGEYGDISSASGGVINEGILSGLLFEVSRWVQLNLSEVGSGGDVTFLEHQSIDRILSPSIITLDENTPPSLDLDTQSSVRLREGILTTEGGQAHLEITVKDIDTDTIAVSADLSGIGLGNVELSDSGLLGDRVIHDSVWTAQISHEGLEFGEIPVTVTMQDIWVSVSSDATIAVTNAPPRMTSLEFSPNSTMRGDQVDVKIEAYDGHGVESVSVDLTSSGGELTPLTYSRDVERELEDGGGMGKFTSELWTGVFIVPHSMTPGKQSIPIEITDSAGATVSTTSTGYALTTASQKPATKLSIGNQPPRISDLTVVLDGDAVTSVRTPTSGNPINHTMEVTVVDLDGISSVQAKIGRLAPIGQSETWILLMDDGSGPDRVAGDGIYSLSFSARSTVSEGNLTVLIRATDVFQSMTPSEEQQHVIGVVKETSGGSGGSWIVDQSMELVIAAMALLLLSGLGAFAYALRNSELE